MHWCTLYYSPLKKQEKSEIFGWNLNFDILVVLKPPHFMSKPFYPSLHPSGIPNYLILPIFSPAKASNNARASWLSNTHLLTFYAYQSSREAFFG
jgi:hypothetical protein